MYWSKILIILIVCLIQSHVAVIKTPVVTPLIPTLPPIQIPNLLNKKIPALPWTLPPLKKLPLLPHPVTPPSFIDSQKLKSVDSLIISPPSADAKSVSSTLPLLNENPSNSVDKIPELSAVEPVVSSPVNEIEKSNSNSSKEVSYNNTLPSDDSKAMNFGQMASFPHAAVNSSEMDASFMKNFTVMTNSNDSNHSVSLVNYKKPLSSISILTPKSIPRYSLKDPSIKMIEQNKPDSKISPLNKELPGVLLPSSIPLLPTAVPLLESKLPVLPTPIPILPLALPLLPAKNLLNQESMKNTENSNSFSLSEIKDSSGLFLNSSSAILEIPKPIPFVESLVAPLNLNSSSLPLNSSSSVILLNLPSNPIYAIPGIDTPVNSWNSSKRAIPNPSSSMTISGTSNLLQQPVEQQQPPMYFDPSSQNYPQYSGVNYQNVQQPFMGQNQPNNFQVPYVGAPGQMYPQLASGNGQNPSQIYQYQQMSSMQNPQIDPLSNLPGIQIPQLNQPMLVQSNETLLVPLPISQGAAAAVTSLLNPSMPVSSSNDNDVQELTPCTCGVFLSGQFKRGSHAQPNGNAVVVNELSQAFTCNSAGKNQCTNKCLDVLVKHLPNSGSIICGSIDRDIRKEKAYLWVKNCKDVWVNTNLSSGKEHCCKDGLPVKCSS